MVASNHNVKLVGISPNFSIFATPNIHQKKKPLIMFRKTVCTLVVAAISLSVFIANAHTMPADKLLAMSDKQQTIR